MRLRTGPLLLLIAGVQNSLASSDDEIKAREAVLIMLANMTKHNRSRWTVPCQPSARACLCSQGCPTSWLGCQPSFLCSVNATSSLLSATREPIPSRKVAILLYLTFLVKDVRHKYAAQPHKAYRREVRRINWFLHTARMRNTTLPICIVVAGDRNRTAEAIFERQGARILEAPFIASPPWVGVALLDPTDDCLHQREPHQAEPHGYVGDKPPASAAD